MRDTCLNCDKIWYLSYGGESVTMNTKLVLAVSFMAIAVISVGVIGMTNNVFAQPAPSNSANVEQQDQHDGQYGDQTSPDTNEKNSAEGAESSDSGVDKDNLQQ